MEIETTPAIGREDIKLGMWAFENRLPSREAAFYKAVFAEDPILVQASLAEWLFTFSPQKRPYVFLNVVGWMAPDDFWRAFHSFWNSFDCIPHSRFARWLNRHRRSWRPEFMCPADELAYELLPDKLTVYRGQSGVAPPGFHGRLIQKLPLSLRRVTEEFKSLIPLS
ncbi:MAG: hypothetical protein EKK29_09465 [Hyphomicrobiales bacterium]|nr:MAG: hypothetical protein EKK29_09465 [Hyphomicrobiales bacterium]